MDAGTGEWVTTTAIPYRDMTGSFSGVVGVDMTLGGMTELVSAQALAGLATVAGRTSGLVGQMQKSQEQVASNVAKVAVIGQANAASAEEGAASAEELNAALEEMAATASYLSKSADGLKRLVGQFRV